jgi:hypothetical protein
VTAVRAGATRSARTAGECDVIPTSSLLTCTTVHATPALSLSVSSTCIKYIYLHPHVVYIVTVHRSIVAHFPSMWCLSHKPTIYLSGLSLISNHLVPNFPHLDNGSMALRSLCRESPKICMLIVACYSSHPITPYGQASPPARWLPLHRLLFTFTFPLPHTAHVDIIRQ